MRTHKREWYIPKGSRKVADKESDAVVYLYESPAKVRVNGMPEMRDCPFAVGFHGKAGKPDFHYRHRSEAERERHIREFFEGRRSSLAFKKELREKRKSPRKLQPGHILYTSWGYDQTNTEFFEVTQLIGDTMVELREIACKVVGSGGCSESIVPVPGKFIGEPMRKRVRDATSVTIDDVRSAWLWSGKPTSVTAFGWGH